MNFDFLFIYYKNCKLLFNLRNNKIQKLSKDKWILMKNNEHQEINIDFNCKLSII